MVVLRSKAQSLNLISFYYFLGFWIQVSHCSRTILVTTTHASCWLMRIVELSETVVYRTVIQCIRDLYTIVSNKKPLREAPSYYMEEQEVEIKNREFQGYPLRCTFFKHPSVIQSHATHLGENHWLGRPLKEWGRLSWFHTNICIFLKWLILLHGGCFICLLRRNHWTTIVIVFLSSS